MANWEGVRVAEGNPEELGGGGEDEEEGKAAGFKEEGAADFEEEGKAACFEEEGAADFEGDKATTLLLLAELEGFADPVTQTPLGLQV